MAALLELQDSESDEEIDMQEDAPPGQADDQFFRPKINVQIKPTEDKKASLNVIELDMEKLDEYSRLRNQLIDFNADLLIFIRCEMAARIYHALNKMCQDCNFSSTQLYSGQKESIKAEPLIQGLVSDLNNIFSTLLKPHLEKTAKSKLKMCPYQIYWVMTQTYCLCLELFARFLKFLRVKKIDESGLHRLKQSLLHIKNEFDQNLRKAEKLIHSNPAPVDTQRLID